MEAVAWLVARVCQGSVPVGVFAGVFLGPAAAGTDLPSWLCGFDSRRPLQPEIAGQPSPRYSSGYP